MTTPPPHPKPRLLLATQSPHKAQELLAILQNTPFQVVTLQDLKYEVPAPEEGDSIPENAALKALHYSMATGYLTLADDSGLEIEALDGAPGPFSKRYAGEKANDTDRIKLVLRKLKKVPWEGRDARFRCALAIASPGTGLAMYEGECRGKIALEPKGTGGFGYDPIFYLPGRRKTMAELTPEQKNQMSHRGRAARKALKLLEVLGQEMSP